MRIFYHVIRFAPALALVVVFGCDNGSSPLRNSIDIIPPRQVTDAAAVISVPSNDVLLTWTAPSDNLIDQPVTQYDIRHLYAPNDDPPDFALLSVPVADPPTPATPGTRQEYVFHSPRAGHNLYIQITSVDEAGNRSPPSGLVALHIPGLSFTGRCVTVYTSQPIPNLTVQLSVGEVYRTTSDTNGEFSRSDLPAGIAHVSVSSDAGDVHSMGQVFDINQDISHTFSIVPIEPTPSGYSDNLLMFTRLLTRTTRSDASTVLRKWARRPVKIYIPPYVNAQNVDYEWEARAAAQRWMERTGISFFAFVDEPPDTGITLHYKPPSQMSGNLVAITYHTDGSDGLPLRDDIEIRDNVSDPVVLMRIILHELGHTIRLGHVADSRFIMFGGQPLPDDISDDEVEAVRLRESLPNLTDMAVYKGSEP